MAHLQ